MPNIAAAELRKYNANSRDHNVGDCTIRSLSVAYGIRYDEVHKELLKYGKEYWYDIVWTQFLQHHGYLSHSKFAKGSDRPTLEEFADAHPSGTYVVCVGKTQTKLSSHAVCLDNGKIWDTWNSLPWFVTEYWLIRKGEDSIQDSPGFDEELRQEYIDFFNEYLAKLKKKTPYLDTYIGSAKINDEYTLTVVFRCVPNDVYAEQFAELIKDRVLNVGWGKVLRTIIKFNPKVDFDENKSKTKEKARVQLREWLYQIRKTIEDVQTVQRTKFNPDFRGDSDDKKLLIKMPLWAQPLLTSCVDYSQYHYDDYDGTRYEAQMNAFPDDPRADTAPIVYFQADTIPELRSDLEAYKKSFSRLNYDY